MSLIRPPHRLSCITFDVTGTLFKYRLHIGDIYCMSAKRVGLECPDYERMRKGFHTAYQLTSQKYPCFGAEQQIDSKTWWRHCVHESFSQVVCVVCFGTVWLILSLRNSKWSVPPIFWGFKSSKFSTNDFWDKCDRSSEKWRTQKEPLTKR